MFKVDKISRRMPCGVFVVTLNTLARSGIFIVNFKHISYFVLVFLLLTLNMELPAGNKLV